MRFAAGAVDVRKRRRRLTRSDFEEELIIYDDIFEALLNMVFSFVYIPLLRISSAYEKRRHSRWIKTINIK